MLPETGRNLVDKFGLSKVNKLLLHYGITDSYKNLTNAQAKYLASFDSIDRIRDTLDETGFLQSGKVSETAKQSRLSKVSKSERLTDLANLSDKAKYASYFSLAGEVEARNVQTRMGMTTEERKAKMLAETEDVAREQQIVLMDAINGMQQSDNRSGVFQTRDGKPIGFNYDTDQVARERFDISKLKKIGSGSDRDVYDLGDGKVLKVAKTARGLTQNIYEGDCYGETLIVTRST